MPVHCGCGTAGSGDGAADESLAEEGGALMQELKDKVAIVTGATRKRGLGRVIALALASGGANVVVTGNSRSTSPVPRCCPH